MKLTETIQKAERLAREALERCETQAQHIAAMPDDAPQEDRDFQQALFERFQEEYDRRCADLERQIALQKAHEKIPLLAEEPSEEREEKQPVRVVKEPLTYRRDVRHSFFRDIVFQNVDSEARERLARHGEEMRREYRDVTTSDPGGASFIPPVYLGSMWIESPRSGRPFANAIRSMPLPPDGMTLSLPRVQTGTAVAIQASENSAVQETDFDSETVSVSVRTIAGQNDVSRQLLERSQPGIDEVIFADLTADYDQKLDAQLLNGSGSSGQHTGIRNVSSVNTVSYTDASPTAAELTPKLYDGIQKIATNRFQDPDLFVMHPRRAAWLASNLSSTFPLFQLGGLYQAAGSQAAGFTAGIAGLDVVRDAQVLTNLGAGTNEDEIYVVRSGDLILAEGPLRSRVFEDVLSGTLQVRLQVYAFSAFITRLPKAITIISGTGLVTPTF